MATNSGDGSPGLSAWTIIGRYNSGDALSICLKQALTPLNVLGEGDVVYDYVDVEAAERLFEAPRGVTELRFECQDYEIKITDGGAIASRPI